MNRYVLIDKAGKTRLTTTAPDAGYARRWFVKIGREGRPIPEGWLVVQRDAPKVAKVAKVAKPHVFQPGDTVRVLESTKWYTKGDIGTFCDGIFNVDFNDHGNREVIGNGRWAVATWDLSLVKKAEPKKAALAPGHVELKMDSGDTLEFWLAVAGGELSLTGTNNAGGPYFIYTIRPDGTAMRAANISLPGLKLNAEGEVML